MSMREGKFIDKNKDRWIGYQAPTEDADELADRFTNLVDDLSYSKTFYPRSKTTKFINALSAKMFRSIYLNEKKGKGRTLVFFKYELPLIFREYHFELLFTFLFFALCVTIAVLSCMDSYDFVRSVLGDGYVDMTEENINKGDPFGVYKEKNSWLMFLQIAFNNINVSFMAIVFGLLGGVGTLYILFQNGIMLGSFHFMFFKKGLGLASILVVWIHGTIEISSIVIAGTAGIILGKGFLFPGTYTRKQSLIRAAQDAAKISIGLIPFFLMAAFLESYITRFTSMPIFVSALILLLSAGLIIWYFIIYPRLLYRNGYRFQDGEVQYPEVA
jgi:uncharacterized membrane protein SpoIIM required for sporulation